MSDSDQPILRSRPERDSSKLTVCEHRQALSASRHCAEYCYSKPQLAQVISDR